MPMDINWYKKALCKIHLDMHCPEWHESIFENFDAGRIISSAKEAGAEALYFFTKDCYGNAYYDTRIGHRHICMGSRDFCAEILEQARKVGLPVMAYYTVIWDNHAAEAHPEWTMRDSEDQPLTDTVTMDVGKWKYLCHNSGYADFAAGQIKEIAAKYPFAGFHLDMFNMDFGRLSCYCQTCQALFREQTGKDLPREPKWDKTWREFLEFRYRTVERFAEKLRNAALEQNSNLCVVMNYHGSPNFDWRVGQKPVRHSLFSDLGTGETYTPMLGDMYPGMESRFIRNLVPGKPFEMVSWRMNRFTDFTVKPLNQLRWEIYTCLANGGSAMLIDQLFYDGRPDPVAYEAMGQVFRDMEPIRPYVFADFVKHVALYYSCRNRDLYARDRQQDFIQPVMGAYKALTENHYCVDFLFDETADIDKLSAYPVVFLPNTAAISDEEAEMFRQYVRQGGKLIATFDTSLYDPNGDILHEFQLSDLFGVRYQKTVDCDTNYFRNLSGSYGRGIDPRYYVLNQGAVHLCEKTTAKGYGDLHDSFFKRILPNRFFSHNVHPPHKRLTEAVFVNRYGKGTCVYIPFKLDGSYADMYELPEHRNLIRNIVDSLSQRPLMEIQAPLNTEVVLAEKEGKVLLHLITFNPLKQAASLPTLNKPIRPSIRMEENPLFKASIKLKFPFGKIRKLRDDTQLRVEGDCVEMVCQNLHELLIIEPK